MSESEVSNSSEPEVCICGYPRDGLSTKNTPCPECGSIVLAKYKSSFSYYGWNVALLGAGITFVHVLFLMVSIDMGLEPPEFLILLPWQYLSMPLGVFSVFCTVISMVKREPKRKSIRNVGMALISGLLFPVGGFIALLIYVSGGGYWTV